MLKKAIKFLVIKVYGDRNYIYLAAVRDRLKKLPLSIREHVEKIGKYNDRILEYHVGSPHKEVNLLKVKIRLALTYNFVLECIGEIKKSDRIVDVGAASGIFLEVFGKKELGVDKYTPHVNAMIKFGIDAVYGQGESLPFDDASFTYGFSFECFEHSQSPLLLLKELARVCRKDIFISVPFRKTSQVLNKKTKHPSDQYHGHIFELSPPDVARVASHCGLRLLSKKEVLLYDSGNGIKSIIRRRYGYNKPSVILLHFVHD